jgi:hypothetical protein
MRQDPCAREPAVEELLRLITHAVEVLKCPGYGIPGEAAGDVEVIRETWERLADSWTDAEGQRLGEWVGALAQALEIPDERRRGGALVKAAGRLHRLALMRLMRRYGVEWPPGGLQLNRPHTGPKVVKRGLLGAPGSLDGLQEFDDGPSRTWSVEFLTPVKKDGRKDR